MTTVERSAANLAPQSTQSSTPPAYSVVIEWENVKLAESDRALEMLRRLSKQMAALARSDGAMRGEVLLICDGDDEAERQELTGMLERTFGAGAADVRVLTITGKYYEKKNKGAASARGSIVVFLDSDVIPEESWLELMVSAFDRPEVDIVAGTTYLDPTSLYSKAFAAFWFFPPRSKEEGLAPAQLIFANNIAFRRELLLMNPLPDLPQSRGQLGALIQNLREQGRAHMFVQRGARCSHPAPNGFVHFIRRAMCEGHDKVMRAQRESGKAQLPWRQSYWSLRSLLERQFRAIRERSEPLGLTAAPRATAIFLALAYAAIAGVGEAATRWNPDWVRRNFAI
jgi:hypothetical protein